MRLFLAGLLALALVSTAGAQRSFEEAVTPLPQYRASDARVLAETHAPELRRLYDDVRRCVPELDFYQPGIGFRKPRGKPQLSPYLSIWMIADESVAPGGDDLGARAAKAFERYGGRLLRRLLARDKVRADGRVGGYGLVLSWLRSHGDERLGETIVLFLDSATVTGFAGGTLGARELLARADIRLFEGDVEKARVPILVDDAKVQPSADGCP
jgi:hypothetical protein